MSEDKSLIEEIRMLRKRHQKKIAEIKGKRPEINKELAWLAKTVRKHLKNSDILIEDPHSNTPVSLDKYIEARIVGLAKFAEELQTTLEGALTVLDVLEEAVVMLESLGCKWRLKGAQGGGQIVRHLIHN
jgi:uncharacterized coiled-coil DUF342 family protein